MELEKYLSALGAELSVAESKKAFDQVFTAHAEKIMILNTRSEGAAVEIEVRDAKFNFKVSPDLAHLVHIKFVNCRIVAIVSDRFASVEIDNCNVDYLLTPENDRNRGESRLRVLNSTVRVVSGNALSVSSMFFKVKIGSIEFDNVTSTRFEYCIIDEVQGKNDGLWSYLVFKKCTFTGKIDLTSNKFGKVVSFEKCYFEIEALLAPYYRDLKQKMSEIHDDSSASEFGAVELKCRDSASTALSDRLLSLGYILVNDYGLKPYRPFKLLCFQFAIATLSWEVIIRKYGMFDRSDSSPELILTAVQQALYLGLASVVGPFKVLGTFSHLELDPLFTSLLMFFYSLLSSLLWYFLIIAIRKKFRVTSN